MHYLDTSVLMAALTNEPRTADVQSWLMDQPTGGLAISDWVVTEFSGAMSIKLRSGVLEANHRADALAMFQSLCETSLMVLPIERAEFRTAAQLANQYETGLRSGDALHLAVVSNHGMRIQSLDRGLVAAAQRLGVSARLI
ncbi:UNVERIFIED_CONTAM: type II toxin-antitoxin system VapC family toxin [Spiribacter pallidus]|jgi:predicted nucleic acid-binding protein